MYNDDGNDNRVVRNGCGGRDDSFNYNNIYSSMHQWYKNKSASLDEDSDSNVRKQHGQKSSKRGSNRGQQHRGCGYKWCRWSGRGQKQKHQLIMKRK